MEFHHYIFPRFLCFRLMHQSKMEFLLSSSGLMNLRPVITLIVVFMISFSSQGQNKLGFETMVNLLLSNDVDTISSMLLAKKIETEKVWLLDSREPAEYGVSHLDGAIYTGYTSFDDKALAGIGKNEAIVVYCSVGKRSEEIARKLKHSGFTNVKNLWGGIFDWTNKGFAVVDMSGAAVNKVHPYSTVWGVWINKSEKAYEP